MHVLKLSSSPPDVQNLVTYEETHNSQFHIFSSAIFYFLNIAKYNVVLFYNVVFIFNIAKYCFRLIKLFEYYEHFKLSKITTENVKQSSSIIKVISKC